MKPEAMKLFFDELRVFTFSLVSLLNFRAHDSMMHVFPDFWTLSTSTSHINHQLIKSHWCKSVEKLWTSCRDAESAARYLYTTGFHIDWSTVCCSLEPTHPLRERLQVFEKSGTITGCAGRIGAVPT